MADKKSKYPKELVQALKDFPHVETVYYNEKAKAWHFEAAEGFEPVPSAEVLATEAE